MKQLDKCPKKSFRSAELASKRAGEINSENSKKGRKNLFRSYKCERCGNYHLTKMSKHQHKYHTDKTYKKEVNTKAFLKKETEYWEERFGIKME